MDCVLLQEEEDEGNRALDHWCGTLKDREQKLVTTHKSAWPLYGPSRFSPLFEKDLLHNSSGPRGAPVVPYMAETT